MPTFETPEPISVTLALGVGDIRISASDRADTVVDVLPSDPAKKGDVLAAEQTRVDFANGRLVVKAPKGWRQWAPWEGGKSGACPDRAAIRVGCVGFRGCGLVAKQRSRRRLPIPHRGR
jgi:hypothetical protein